MLHSRPFERAISISVIGLILWLGVTTDYIVLLPWIRESAAGSRPRILLTLLFNICWVMTLWSFVMAGWTEPGSVPIGYKLAEGEGGELNRWCRKCNRVKPPRTHHCKGCGRCVLRMDHHCPWIGNCVGYWNHGHFLRFLSYACLCLLFAFLGTLHHLMFMMPGMIFEEVSQLRIIIAVVNGAFEFCLLVMVGILTVYQWSNCLDNMTTIEHLEWDTAVGRARRRGNNGSISIIFPFDLGSPKENLKVILGPQIWSWPFPLPDSLEGQGDGISFQVNSAVPPRTQWPPTFDDDDDEAGRARSLSNPSLVLDRRERFRRGSEGYMIPNDQIGVQFHEEGEDDEAEKDTIRRSASHSSPLLTIVTDRT